MERKIINGIDTVRFDSYNELIEFCKSKKPTSFEHASSEMGRKNYQWTKTRTFEDAIKLASDGWKEGAGLVKKIVDDKIHAIGKSYTFVPKYDTSGDSVDMSRFMAGEPENMIEWEFTETAGHKVVDIYCGVCASAAYSAESLINYGAARLSVVDYLESIGVRVNLYAYWAFGDMLDSHVKKIVIIKIKNADESLNMATTSFALAHPSFLRRILFRVAEILPGMVMYCYGLPKEFEKKDWAGTEDSVVFQCINNIKMDWSEESTIQKFIDKNIPETLNSLEVSLDTNFSHMS